MSMVRQSDGESPGAFTRELADLRRTMESVLLELRRLGEIMQADLRTADRLITAQEAGVLLGCSRSKVYGMVRAGLLPSRKDGSGRIRLSFLQVQKYIRG